MMNPGNAVICRDDSPGRGENVKGLPCPVQAGMIYQIDKVWISDRLEHELCTIVGIDLGFIEGKPIGFSTFRFQKIEC